MAYSKTEWKNKIVQNPKTYQLQQNADGTVTLIPKEGTVIQAGTPVSADNMNKIENGIFNNDVGISNFNTKSLESTGYGVISGLTVTAQSTPDMTINVASGIVHMANGDRLTPAGNSALTITTADTTNPRKDIIYVKSDGAIGYTAGTPASSPVAPSTPDGAFLLAEINVTANATTITNSNITDKRKIKNTTDNLQSEFSSHNTDNLYQTAGGTATAITLIIAETLTNGLPITFIASTDNGGAVTTINSKHLYKPNTTDTPNLKAGKAYTIWYNSASDCFFLKASAEGNAIAENVLAGKTFSNDADAGLVGTMDLSNLISNNIRNGITINNITGNMQSKEDFENYIKNFTGTWSNIVEPVSFVDGEGLWVSRQADSTYAYVDCYDINGTLIKTIKTNDSGGIETLAVNVTKNYVVWGLGSSFWITDKNGTIILNRVSDSQNYYYAICLHENKGYVYYVNNTGMLKCINLSGTLIYSLQLDTFNAIVSIVLCKTGIFIITSQSGSTLMYYIEDNGIKKYILSNNNYYSLFADVLVNV